MPISSSDTRAGTDSSEVLPRPSRVALLRDVLHATGLLSAAPRRAEGHRLALSDQSPPAVRLRLRIRPDAVEDVERARLAIGPAVTDINEETAKLLRMTQAFDTKLGRSDTARLSRQGRRSGTADDLDCDDVLALWTDARCCMARLQLRVATAMLSAETIIGSGELVADCGWEESPCLAPLPSGRQPLSAPTTQVVLAERPAVDRGGSPAVVHPATAVTVEVVRAAYAVACRQLLRAAEPVGKTAYLAFRNRAETWLRQHEAAAGNPATVRATLGPVIDTAAEHLGRTAGEATARQVDELFADPEATLRRLTEMLTAPVTDLSRLLAAEKSLGATVFHPDRLARAAEAIAETAAGTVLTLGRPGTAGLPDIRDLDAFAHAFGGAPLEDMAVALRAAVMGTALKALLQESVEASRIAAGQLAAALRDGG